MNLDKISSAIEHQIRAYAVSRDTAAQYQTLIGLGMSEDQARTIAVSVEEIGEEDE